MNIADAKQQVRDTVEAYLSQDETGAYLIPELAQRPIFLLGAPGIGKTAIVSQVANDLGIGLVSYSMTHHTRQSALGLPSIVRKVFDGEEFSVSEYTMSEIISAIYEYAETTGHKTGILFLDEVNCVSETLYPSMLQFLQFKTFGRHKVPDGWIVVCAGNPPEYNKSVHDFDVVTLDRLRKIPIEPDLEAWLDYACATGVHPAITSYLEVRRDDFYSVHSTPTEKSFVTARSWDDLSQIISLYEVQGKEIGRALISQYIQDDRISDRFTQYYMLFTKYRGDYQIPNILAGDAAPELTQRARNARFDERLAVINLMLEALDGTCQDALEAEQRTAALRDSLREVKPQILSGAAMRPALEAAAESLANDAKARVSAHTATDFQVRPLRLAVQRLGEYALACELNETAPGQETLDFITHLYESDVSELKEKVQRQSAAIDNAFAFLEEAFGDGREIAVFVAELTGHGSTSKFIGTFGSDSYYAHNASVQIHTNRNRLLNLVESLEIGDVE